MHRGTVAALAALALAAAACGTHTAPPPDPFPGAAPSLGEAPPPDPFTDEQPPPGVFHRVLPGQTLFTISRTYGVAMEEIVAANSLEEPDRIEAGALLLVPGAVNTLDVPITVPRAGEFEGLFALPVRGTIGSRYGPRNGRMHYGVDIAAPAGTNVRASRDGVVLYAGSTYRGYGKLVIVEHPDGFRTLYAHNRRLRTRSGRRVRSGDVIAEVGATGNATGPHLHFEIRKNDAPLDPLIFINSAGGQAR